VTYGSNFAAIIQGHDYQIKEGTPTFELRLAPQLVTYTAKQHLNPAADLPVDFQYQILQNSGQFFFFSQTRR
jgi:hypothetical protein